MRVKVCKEGEKPPEVYFQICLGDAADASGRRKKLAATTMKVRQKKKIFTQDHVITVIGNLLLAIFLLLIIIPIIYILLCSIMDPATRSSVGVTFDISHWTLEGYERVFQDENIWRGFANSFFYSIAFTAISVVITMFAAYPMSREDFMGRKFFNAFFVFTMFFGGGLMPTYLLMDQLGLINTIWAILLPGAANVWNLILARSYYKTVPGELREAAAVDGASDMQYFLRFLCRSASRSLQYFACISLWLCGTRILTQ